MTTTEDPGRPAITSDRDLLIEAVNLSMTQPVSESILQRKLHLGWARAAWLIDDLEVLGVVGPGEGGGPRRILLSPDDLDAVLAKIRSEES